MDFGIGCSGTPNMSKCPSSQLAPILLCTASPSFAMPVDYSLLIYYNSPYDIFYSTVLYRSASVPVWIDPRGTQVCAISVEPPCGPDCSIPADMQVTRKSIEQVHCLVETPASQRLKPAKGRE